MKNNLAIQGLKNLWKRFLTHKNNYYAFLKTKLRTLNTESLSNYDKYIDTFVETVKNEYNMKLNKKQKYEMTDDECDELLFNITNDKIMNYTIYTLNCGVNIEPKKNEKSNLFKVFKYRVQLIGIWFKSVLMAFNSAILIPYKKYRDKKRFIDETRNNFKSVLYRNNNNVIFSDYRKKRLDTFAENMYYAKKLNKKINLVNN